MTNAATTDEVFAGFWARLAATLIDVFLISVITIPILLAAYGPRYWEQDALIHGPLDFLVSWVLPAIACILLWIYKQATPGKMAFGLRIVDAQTGQPASTGQYVGRYFAYLVSLLPLCLGYLWVIWDPRKQAWHDKLASTVVVRRVRQPQLPTFQRPA